VSDQDNDGYRSQMSALTLRLEALENSDPKDYDTDAKGNHSNKALVHQEK
jgi:hypothetical protein